MRCSSQSQYLMGSPHQLHFLPWPSPDLTMRQRALLLRVVLVACGCLLSGPRVASGHEEVHTNARYIESVHGKPVIVYKAIRHFYNYISLKKMEIVKAEGTLGLIPVPTCTKEHNPCPFDANGKRHELWACKASRTVNVHLKDKHSNKTVVQSFTHKVHSECFCKSQSEKIKDIKMPCSEENIEKVERSNHKKDNIYMIMSRKGSTQERSFIV